MATTARKSPSQAHRKIWVSFIILLTAFALMTISNEIFDLPHYLLGDEPTSFAQRKGEVLFELLEYSTIIAVSLMYFRKRLEKEIKILEGFIPICANCKKIRRDIDWETLEHYISEHSLATFSHAICPECIKALYPDYADEILTKMKERDQR